MLVVETIEKISSLVWVCQPGSWAHAGETSVTAPSGISAPARVVHVALAGCDQRALNLLHCGANRQDEILGCYLGDGDGQVLNM